MARSSEAAAASRLAVKGYREQERGRVAEAAKSYSHSLRLEPTNEAVWNNLGAMLQIMGAMPAAVNAFLAARELAQDNAIIVSNLLFALTHDWSKNEDQIATGHFALAPRSIPELVALQTPRKRDRLRVGYLSPGFGEHAIAQFLALPPHNPKQVEIFVYSTKLCRDRLTRRYAPRSQNWFDISEYTDQDACSLIRSHQLDILVERGGYCAENRLGLMALALAPAMVSMSDYPATLGMPGVHYRLTDAYLNPPGSERYYTEKLVKLPIAMCYTAPARPPAVSALPAASNHFVTFAAFHRLFKLSPVLLEAYVGILHRVPRSRLILHHAFGNGPRVGSKLKRRVESTLSEHGISAKRLTWVGTLPHRESMALYQQVDLALDAYPCSGVTTTAEALYMGVPVVSWYDQQPRSRQSLAMLAAVGLEDLATDSAARFADRAVEWASNWTRLAQLRRVLRKRMRGSPLCDAAAFARSLEAAYRDMLHTATTECKEPD